MRKLAAIFAAFCFISAPVLAQAPAPQFIALNPDAEPPDTEGIVIPAGSPVHLVAFPRDQGSTATFGGRFTLSGAYEIIGYGEDATVTLWPDQGIRDQLPYWQVRGGPEEIYLTNPWAFAEAVAAKGQLQKLKVDDGSSIRGQVTIIADDYTAMIDCDSANFSVRFVSIVKAVEIAALPPTEEGC